MKPKRHKARLLRWMTHIRDELSAMHTEGHFQYIGYKSIDCVERDVEMSIQEVETTELLKGKKNAGQ